MIYNLSQPFDVERAKTYFNRLIVQEKKIDLKQAEEKRTNNQNSYLHLLLGIYGLDMGYTIEESKTVIKRELGLMYEKNGQKFLRSTADLSKEELSTFIDQFKKLAAEQGCFLPDAETPEMSDYVSRNKVWL